MKAQFNLATAYGASPKYGAVKEIELLQIELVKMQAWVKEVGDRVVMKRDLQIAREIQTWLLPGAPPQRIIACKVT